MRAIQKSMMFKIMSGVLIVAFIAMDLSWAYPAQETATLAPESFFKRKFENYIDNNPGLLFAVQLIHERLCGASDEHGPQLGVDKIAEYVRGVLGPIAEGIRADYIQVTDKKVVLIPYEKGDKHCIIQIAAKDSVTQADLVGYDCTVNDNYVMKIVPEGYEGKPAPQPEPGKAKEATIGETVADVQGTVEIQGGQHTVRFTIKAIFISALALLIEIARESYSLAQGLGKEAVQKSGIQGGTIFFTVCAVAVALTVAGLCGYQWWKIKKPVSYYLWRTRSPNAPMRLDAIEKLAALGDKRALPRFIQMLNDSRMHALPDSYGDDVTYCSQLIKGIGTLGDDTSADFLTTFLRVPNAAIRHILIETLGNFPNNGKAFTAVRTALTYDESSSVRAQAAETLSVFAFPDAVSYLIPALTDTSKMVNIKAAQALARMNWQPRHDRDRVLYYIATGEWSKITSLDRETVKRTILDMLKRTEHSVGIYDTDRQRGLGILISLHVPESLTYLVDVLRSAETNLGEEYIEGLNTASLEQDLSVFGAAAVPQLIELLKHSNPVVVKCAIGALMYIGGKEIPAQLIPLLKHATPCVRQKAAIALGLFGAEDAAEPLALLFEDEARQDMSEAGPQAEDRFKVLLASAEALDFIGKLEQARLIKPLLKLIVGLLTVHDRPDARAVRADRMIRHLAAMVDIEPLTLFINTCRTEPYVKAPVSEADFEYLFTSLMAGKPVSVRYQRAIVHKDSYTEGVSVVVQKPGKVIIVRSEGVSNPHDGPGTKLLTALLPIIIGAGVAAGLGMSWRIEDVARQQEAIYELLKYMLGGSIALVTMVALVYAAYRSYMKHFRPIPYYISLLGKGQDTEIAVRRLTEYGRPVIPFIKEALDKGKYCADFPHWSMSIMAGIVEKDASAVEDLFSFTHHPSKDVRYEAMKVLSWIVSKKVMDRAIEIAGDTGEDSQVRCAAIEALDQYDDRKAFDTLFSLMFDTDLNVIAMARWVLGARPLPEGTRFQFVARGYDEAMGRWNQEIGFLGQTAHANGVEPLSAPTADFVRHIVQPLLRMSGDLGEFNRALDAIFDKIDEFRSDQGISLKEARAMLSSPEICAQLFRSMRLSDRAYSGTVSQEKTGDQKPAEGAREARELFEVARNNINNAKAKVVDAVNRIVAYIRENKELSAIAPLQHPVNAAYTTVKVKARAEDILKALKDIEKHMTDGWTDLRNFPPEIMEARQCIENNLSRLEADSVVQSIIILAEKAREEKQSLIIGMETDWVPGLDKEERTHQQAHLSPLLRDIDGLKATLRSIGITNVEIVHTKSEALADTLMKRAGELNTAWSNMVILASNKTVGSKAFTPLIQAAPEARPFITAINPSQLEEHYRRYGEVYDKQLFVNILQMLSLSLELATGAKSVPNMPYIVSYDQGKRMLVILAPVEAVDVERLDRLYRGLQKALASA
ncbi:MAG: HEAT repeat domain-containing protein [Candidatus Omnitrophica bacterium]|nr:HEAT repeat domain-containing protein [Candidatus Omnitrophota bacterium]